MRLRLLPLVVLLILLLPAGRAQRLQPVAIDSLPFGNFEIDTLYIARDSSQIKLFYNKLDKVLREKKGHVSILHLGGSHVQAGTMSNRIRRDILNNCPDLVSSRGIIFPYSAANKCNNPGDYRVKRTVEFNLVRNVYQNHVKTLGGCGIAVYSCDSTAVFSIRLVDSGINYATTRVTLLGYPCDTVEVLPSLVVRGQEIFPQEYSSVMTRYRFDLPTPTDSFAVKLNCHDSADFTVTGILLENDRPGITFHSIGVNGASTDSYLRCVNFVQDMELIAPDLVIFGIGINDAAGTNFDTVVFRRNYLAIIQRIREVNPDCAFIFLTNNDSYRGSGRHAHANRNGLLVRETFYRLADEVGGAVWDQFDIMGGLGSVQRWRSAGYAQSDRVHFTAKGYNLVGDLFYNAFVDAYRRVLGDRN